MNNKNNLEQCTWNKIKIHGKKCYKASHPYSRAMTCTSQRQHQNTRKKMAKPYTVYSNGVIVYRTTSSAAGVYAAPPPPPNGGAVMRLTMWIKVT